MNNGGVEEESAGGTDRETPQILTTEMVVSTDSKESRINEKNNFIYRFA